MVDAPRFDATFLVADGRRMTKVYRGDAYAEPTPYDDAKSFRVVEHSFATLAEFADALAELPPNVCLIRGGVRPDAREFLESGSLAYRRVHDSADGAAVFESVARNWLVLDVDASTAPLVAGCIEGSITAFMAGLPPEIRDAPSAFVLSASAHRSATVRGKLLVQLAEPLDGYSAERWATEHGFDGCVCRSVQPNYFAPPIFEGCEDPIAEHRHAWHFPGTTPARLPVVTRESGSTTMGDREVAPSVDDSEPVSPRVERLLTPELWARWQEGDRVSSNAWLHLAGWLLGKGWAKSELAQLLDVLDCAEGDRAKVAEHRHILDNARAIEGPGAAREWLGAALFQQVDAALVERDTVVDAYAAKVAARFAADGEGRDELGRAVDWSTPITPVRYLCAGLGIGWTGKVTGVHGYAGTSKGMFLARLALSAASGRDMLGHPVVQTPVLYCDAETGPLAENRIKRLALAMGIDLAALARAGWFSFRHVSRSLPELLDGGEHGPLGKAIAETDKGSGVLVCLDSYSSLVGGDENSSEYADPMWRLGQLCGELGAIPACIIHERKQREGVVSLLEGISGTNRMAAALSVSIRLTQEDSAKDRVITVTNTRAAEKRFEPLQLEWRDTPEGGIDCVVAVIDTAKVATRAARRERMQLDAKMAKVNADVAELVSKLQQWAGCQLSPRKIRSSLGWPATRWHDCRREAERRKLITILAVGAAADGGIVQLADYDPAVLRTLIEGG